MEMLRGSSGLLMEWWYVLPDAVESLVCLRVQTRWYGTSYWPRQYFIMRIFRVGQNHICTVYIRYFWQGNHQIYGHIRCIYLVLANPTYFVCESDDLQG